MQLCLALAALAALASALLARPALAQPNPINAAQIVVRDPAIWYNAASRKYFVFATDEGVKIFTATSLTGSWTRAGSVLPSHCSVIQMDGNCNVWAPDINYYNGEYVLYYAISALGSQNSAIGVATSQSMEAGTWTDHGKVIGSATGDVYNAIDANLIYDNGLKLSFGSYWNGMYQVGLWPDVETQASALPGTHLAGGNGRAAEGGFVYKPASSSYFFFFFSDGTTPLPGATSYPAAGQEYKVRAGRGTSSMGPFVGGAGHQLTEDIPSAPTGNLILGSHDNVYAPGGQSIFHDPVSGRDVMVYHYIRKSDPVGSNSYLGINYLDFSSGWPVVVA